MDHAIEVHQLEPTWNYSNLAHVDSLRVLREERAFDVEGIMHYFQGSIEDAKQAIDLGFYISIARPLFRIEELQNVVKKLPLEHFAVTISFEFFISKSSLLVKISSPFLIDVVIMSLNKCLEFVVKSVVLILKNLLLSLITLNKFFIIDA